jgi:hypothetical protein
VAKHDRSRPRSTSVPSWKDFGALMEDGREGSWAMNYLPTVWLVFS